MKPKLKGLGVAVITPFLQDGEVDYESLEKLVDGLITGGVDYLAALGTTSETPTLCEEEKSAILKTIIKATAGRVPVVMGLGGPCTQNLIAHLRNDDFSGVEAIFSVTPYYNKPSQEGLYEHYCEIAYHSPLPVILYNVGPRTSCNLEPATTLRLARDCEKIIAIKEASGNMNQIMHLIKHKPEDFLVISGDDGITLPLLAVGIDGLISVIGNAYPKLIADMVHLALNENFHEARMIHHRMLDLIQACFREGSPAGIKAIMALQGKIEYYLRLPLTRVSPFLQNQLRELMEYI